MDSSETTTWTFRVATANEPGRLCLLFFLYRSIDHFERNELGVR